MVDEMNLFDRTKFFSEDQIKQARKEYMSSSDNEIILSFSSELDKVNSNLSVMAR